MKLLFRFLQNFWICKIIVSIDNISFNAGIFFQERVQLVLCFVKRLLSGISTPNIIIGIIDKILGGIVRKLILLQELLNRSIHLIFPRG